MTKKQDLQITLFTARDDLNEWLHLEAQGTGFQVAPGEEEQPDFSGSHAILCLALDEPDRAEKLFELAQRALLQGLDVIWLVSGVGEWYREAAEELRKKGQWILESDELDATQVLEMLRRYQEEWEKKNAPEEPTRTLAIPKLRIKKLTGTHKESVVSPSPLPRIFPNVIAVGGHRGCGSSFVAWNAAALLDIPLLEGKTSGALAAWFQVEEEDTRLQFLQEGRIDRTAGVQAAVTAAKPPSEQELQFLSKVNRPVVVDVGDDLDNELWKRAKTKLFVTTPDPQWKRNPFPPGVTRVMNRMPVVFPAPPEGIFGVKVDLVIPDLGRQALLSLWSLRAWILTQGHEVAEQWKKVLDVSDVRKDEQDLWNDKEPAEFLL